MQREPKANAPDIRYWVALDPDGRVTVGWPGAAEELVLSRAEACHLAQLLLATDQAL